MSTIHYVWDELSDNVLMEVDDGGVTVAQYTNEPSQFGDLISQRRSGTTSYYNFDGDRSTRQLTDDSQNVTDTAAYTGFGEVVAKTGSTNNPFGFKGAVGYYTDQETGEQYVRARVYAPLQGRWLSIDPLGFLDGPNLYQAYFVPGGIDPTGLRKVCCKFRRGWVIKERFGREINCPEGKSALTCCKDFVNIWNWFGVEGAFDGPCNKKIIVPPMVLLQKPQVTTVCRVNPVVAGVTCVATVLVYCVTCHDQEYPPDTDEEPKDECWCCDLQGNLDDPSPGCATNCRWEDPQTCWNDSNSHCLVPGTKDNDEPIEDPNFPKKNYPDD